MATPLSINQLTHGDKGVGTAYTSKHALFPRALVLFLERGRHPPLTSRTKLKSAKFNANLMLVPQGKLKTKRRGGDGIQRIRENSATLIAPGPALIRALAPC